MTTAPLTEARALEIADTIMRPYSLEALTSRTSKAYRDSLAHFIAAVLLRYTTEAYEAGKKEGRNGIET